MKSADFKRISPYIYEIPSGIHIDQNQARLEGRRGGEAQRVGRVGATIGLVAIAVGVVVAVVAEGIGAGRLRPVAEVEVVGLEAIDEAVAVPVGHPRAGAGVGQAAPDPGVGLDVVVVSVVIGVGVVELGAKVVFLQVGQAVGVAREAGVVAVGTQVGAVGMPSPSVSTAVVISMALTPTKVLNR